MHGDGNADSMPFGPNLLTNLATAIVGAHARPAAGGYAPAVELTSGAIIAKRFQLDRLLGEGGMGTVWAATHTVTRRSHALKFLKADAKSQQQRFIREARAASAVDHPHVMRIEDVFELEDGNPVLVLELLNGEPLSARIERDGKLDVKEMSDLLLPVVSAVGAAHAAGIIHRDLKPDNIFIADGQVKVLDFGIAKMGLDAELASPEGSLTKTGALVGSPFYMSPEQASGERVDHRTDIWSLGIIAYQLLSGVVPTKADTVGAALKIVMTARFPPLGSQNVEVAEDVLTLVGQMLALEPADRPTDLRRVFDTLSHHSNVVVPTFGPPSANAEHALPANTSGAGADADLATGEWLAERVAPAPPKTPDAGPGGSITAAATVAAIATSPPKSGRRWLVPGVAVAAVAIGGVLWLRPERTPPPPPTEATVVASVAVDTLREPELGLQALSKYRSHVAQQGAMLSSASWWTTAATDFEEASAQDGAPKRWKAAEHFARGQSWVRRGSQKDALDEFQKASALDSEWAEPHTGMSSALLMDGRFEEALNAARTAQRLDPSWWRAVVSGARVLNKKGQIDEAIQEYRRALALVPDSALVLSELALTYHAARLDSEAGRYGDRALKIDPDMSAVRLMFAERALETINGKEALEQATRAVAVSPRDVGARLALGDALALLGKRDEAKAAYRAMLDLLTDGKIPGGVPKARVALVKKLVPTGQLPPPRVSNTQPIAQRSLKSKAAPEPVIVPRTSARSSAASVEENY